MTENITTFLSATWAIITVAKEDIFGPMGALAILLLVLVTLLKVGHIMFKLWLKSSADTAAKLEGHNREMIDLMTDNSVKLTELLLGGQRTQSEGHAAMREMAGALTGLTKALDARPCAAKEKQP